MFGSACSPDKVGSSRSFPRRGSGVVVQCRVSIQGEACRKAYPRYLREGKLFHVCCLTCWPWSRNGSHFALLLICVRESWRIDFLLSQCAVLGFWSLPVTCKYHCMHPFRMVIYYLYGLFRNFILSITCIICTEVLNDLGISFPCPFVIHLYVGYIP